MSSSIHGVNFDNQTVNLTPNTSRALPNLFLHFQINFKISLVLLASNSFLNHTKQIIYRKNSSLIIRSVIII